jgi:uncharacterized protein YjbI with pentapeptide repeats
MPKSLTVFKQSANDWNRHHMLSFALDVFRFGLPPGRDLNFHDFSGQELDTIDFSANVISCSSFQNTQLAYARFCETRLGGTSFQGANLTAADFSFAWCDGLGNSGGADDPCANQSTRFNEATLDRAIFHNTHLKEVDFSNATLLGTKFVNCDLDGACFDNVVLENTVFSGVDLSTIHGLDSVVHKGPSYLDIQSLVLSKGKLSEKFLRGVVYQINLLSIYHPSYLKTQFNTTLVSSVTLQQMKDSLDAYMRTCKIAEFVVGLHSKT